MDGWMDRQTDGWMEGWTDKWTDGWTLGTGQTAPTAQPESLGAERGSGAGGKRPDTGKDTRTGRIPCIPSLLAHPLSRYRWHGCVHMRCQILPGTATAPAPPGWGRVWNHPLRVGTGPESPARDGHPKSSPKGCLTTEQSPTSSHPTPFPFLRSPSSPSSQDVPGTSPAPLRARLSGSAVDPEAGISPSSPKSSASTWNGALPGWAFFPPFPAGSGVAPTPAGGAGMSSA